MGKIFLIKKRIKEGFFYFKEKNTKLFVLTVLLMICIGIILGGCLLLSLLPENKGSSLSDIFWVSLRLFMDPGGFLGDKLTVIATIVTCMIVLCGMVAFTGGAVGYVTNMISDKMEQAKEGAGTVKLSDFTLILNWNDRGLAYIFDKIADIKNDNRQEYIVILSENNKEELEEQIRKEIKSYRNATATTNKNDPRIIVRQGCPRYTTDLEKVCQEDASTIIILQPEDSEDPDYDVVRTYFALVDANKYYAEGIEDDEEDEINAQIFNGEIALCNVIAEVSDAATGRMLSNYKIPRTVFHAFSVQTISNHFSLGKIFGFIALNPDLAGTVNEILSRSGSTIKYVEKNEDMASLEEAMLSYQYAIPLFGSTYEDGDAIRLFLSSDDQAASSETEFTRIKAEDRRYQKKKAEYDIVENVKGHRIVIYGVNEKLSYILNTIVAYNHNAEEKCKIVLIGDSDQMDVLHEYYMEAEYQDCFETEPVCADKNSLIRDNLELFDDDLRSFLILSRDDETGAIQDRSVFKTWISIVNAIESMEGIREKLERKIILEVKNPLNAKLINQSLDRKVIVSNELIGLMMSLLTDSNANQSIFMDIISFAGDKDFAALEKEEDESGEKLLIENMLDLITVKGSVFTDGKESESFMSKQDFIYHIFSNTNREYVPIGLVRYGTTYLFTNGCCSNYWKKELGIERIDLSTGYLIERDGDSIDLMDEDLDQIHKYREVFVIKADDEIVMIKRIFEV